MIRHVPEQIKAMQSPMLVYDDGIAVPWSSIHDSIEFFNGLPESGRRELGIPGATDPDDALKKLKAAHSNLPANFSEIKDLLVANPAPQPLPVDNGSAAVRMMQKTTSGESTPTTTKPDSKSQPGPKAPTIPQGIEVAKCFLNGGWDGIVRGTGFLGYVLGCSVKLPYRCGKGLSDLLVGWGGGPAFYNFVNTAIQQGIQAALKVLQTMSASTAVAIYAFMLSAEIQMANEENGPGIILYIPWPPYGPPPFVLST